MNIEIAREFFDGSIRLDDIFHLGMQTIDPDAWPDSLREVFEDDWDELWKALDIDTPKDIDDDCYPFEELVSDHLRRNRKEGFLVRFTTPVPRNIHPTGFSFSWGVCQIFWIYGESLDAIYAEAIEWRDNYIAEERAKATVSIQEVLK